MASLIRTLLSLLWLSGFVFALVNIAEYWEYDAKAPDIDQMLRSVSSEQANQHVQQALDSGEVEHC